MDHVQISLQRPEMLDPELESFLTKAWGKIQPKRGNVMAQLVGLRGKNTGESHISWENLWFPVIIPLNQPIEWRFLRRFLWHGDFMEISMAISWRFQI